MNSTPISSPTQTHFQFPSNPYKTSFIKSSSHISFNFTNPVIFLKTTRNSPPKSAATDRTLYTPSPEETLYELLGISESVPLSEIKRAYKQMALKYHPDVSPPGRVDENTMRFIKVQEAYETLSDPDARAMYDSCMAKGLQLHSDFSGKTRWKESWQVQVAELKRRRTMDYGGRKSWATRIRKQRREAETEQPPIIS